MIRPAALLPEKLQGRLLSLAALFFVLYALGLSVAPAVQARSWPSGMAWSHWGAVAVWMALFYFAHHQTRLRLPQADPYLLPIAGLLSGWGLLTIWRLFPNFGLRQLIWLGISVAVFTAGLRLPANLSFLRRYKYLWLTGALLLTGLTLLLGVNPSGATFPHLWLGCCGLYLQPSEPLKLLLIGYLAAYLADRLIVPSGALGTWDEPDRSGWLARLLRPHLPPAPLLPLLAPTLVMTGLALLLLVVQRDLGTASIFLFLYAAMIYITSGRRRVLVLAALTLLLAAVAGYALFGVVRVRVDAWLNPWLDPSGSSYQIVQSLIAVANGGLVGRGPGMGSPELVPVPHSDFIFAAIAEETGLAGITGMLALLALLALRGLRVAFHAPGPYRRYLAAGLTAYLVGQSVLIIGGNLRLVPLTGVTLPFVSYGGSSLLTSFVSLVLLVIISHQPEERPSPLPHPQPYLQLGAFLLAGLAACALLAGWWSVVRSEDLLARTDNLRRAIADQFVQRGAILDRDNQPVNLTTGQPGEYVRQTLYPPLSNVAGYTDPVYGQSGLEAAIDPYLRGLQGNPEPVIWWNYLLYGQPPPGLDVRLTIDLDLQQRADEGLDERRGAAVVLNASSGEILAMASHPTFDANQLDEQFEELIEDPEAPLLNRATQGRYAPGAALGPLLLAAVAGREDLPEAPAELAFELGEATLRCSLSPAEDTWPALIASGCPGPAATLARDLGPRDLEALYRRLGLYESPQIRLPVEAVPTPAPVQDPANAALGEELLVSPLQMALAAAPLSAGGERPAPWLVQAVNTPESGWMILSRLSIPVEVFSDSVAEAAAQALAVPGTEIWQVVATAPAGTDETLTWYLGGTLPGWAGTPYVVVVLLEADAPLDAMQTGQALLRAAMQP